MNDGIMMGAWLGMLILIGVLNYSDSKHLEAMKALAEIQEVQHEFIMEQAKQIIDLRRHVIDLTAYKIKKEEQDVKLAQELRSKV